MARRMCSECPFNPNSSYCQKFGVNAGVKWAEVQYDGIPESYKELEEDCFSSMEFPHGCHMIEDIAFHPDPEKQCIGHKKYLESIRTKKGLPVKPLLYLKVAENVAGN